MGERTGIRYIAPSDLDFTAKPASEPSPYINDELFVGIVTIAGAFEGGVRRYIMDQVKKATVDGACDIRRLPDTLVKFSAAYLNFINSVPAISLGEIEPPGAKAPPGSNLDF